MLIVHLTGVSLARAPASTASTVQEQTREVTVTGVGVASAQPNIAQASVGVQVISPTVAQATQEDEARMAAVIAKLKELGVSAEDELFFSHVHLHGGPAPVRRFLPELIGLIWNRKINPANATLFTVRTDQSGLVGLLRHLHGPGFMLLCVSRVGADGSETGIAIHGGAGR